MLMSGVTKSIILLNVTMLKLFDKQVTRPEMKRVPACTRIRMKILPYILKARESANMFPFNIQARVC